MAKSMVPTRYLFTTWMLNLLILSLSLSVLNPASGGEIITPEVQWRYTTEQPTGEWFELGYDANGWSAGIGGFGTRGTPGARIGTEWDTQEIWLRRTVHLDQVPEQAALLIHHDDAVTVYLNGKQVADLAGYTDRYQLVPLSAEARVALHDGDNLLALHCRQTTGGQFVDAFIVDQAQPPELPALPEPVEPYRSDLITTWGKQVTAANAWREYPRPHLVRPRWQNLNGMWEYAISPLDDEAPATWQGQILVPFCLESRLSGVQRLLRTTEALWYRRSFTLTDAQPSERTLLHFEAVDYRCQVWVNDRKVGEHIGGNLPFSFDITEALRAGENRLTVRVEDKTSGAQLRGKQTLEPSGIWYTRVSGIWQTVWLEQVPSAYIEELDVLTDIRSGSVTIVPTRAGTPTNASTYRVTVLAAGQPVTSASASNRVTATIPNARLWSPSDPHLYDLRVELLDANGETIDTVTSYCGLREVGRQLDANGHHRMTLNGKPLFHLGPLDQGWWPDGLLTPPSDEAIQFELSWLKQAGFNMLRKHIKVEPRRYYYHCDRLGLLVWQDQVSGGANPPWTHLDPNPTDAEWTDADHRQYMAELESMVDLLEPYPSIVVWVPFNEAWGQHRTVEVGKWLAARDPSRLVNVASGGNFWPAGDIVDEHRYPHPDFPFDPARYRDFIMVVGEFGGHGWPVVDHVWENSKRNWGYGGLPRSEAEYLERYRESMRRLEQLKGQGIAAGVYTQTTDVEGEINGLMTYDRKVIKIPAELLRTIHAPLIGP